jgi:hypothetical protein
MRSNCSWFTSEASSPSAPQVLARRPPISPRRLARCELRAAPKSQRACRSRAEAWQRYPRRCQCLQVWSLASLPTPVRSEGPTPEAGRSQKPSTRPPRAAPHRSPCARARYPDGTQHVATFSGSYIWLLGLPSASAPLVGAPQGRVVPRQIADDETQKDAAILLGPSRPVGKSSINCLRDSFHTEVPVQIWPS